MSLEQYMEFTSLTRTDRCLAVLIPRGLILS